MASLKCFVAILIFLKATHAMICLEQSTNEKKPVIWPNTVSSSKRIISNPICLTQSQELITRTCNMSGWYPSHDNTPNCYTTQSKPPLEECPPLYSSIVDRSGKIKFCYHLTAAKSWNYPCLDSGSTSTLLDLSTEDLVTLSNKLTFTERKLVWFPARRITSYGPIVSTVAGREWGKELELESIYSRLSITQDCLLYDLDKFDIKIDNCTYKYPAICISNTKHLSKLHCPDGYKTTKYKFQDGRCYGIEVVDKETTWKKLISDRCPQPMQISNQLENQLLQELADDFEDELEDMCFTGIVKNASKYSWYPNKDLSFVNWNSQIDFDSMQGDKYGIVEEKLTWNLVSTEEKLKCMVCQKSPSKITPEVTLQPSSDQESLLLTIYYPSGLWKENDDDIGIHCFSNALGFVTKIKLEAEKLKKIKYPLRNFQKNSTIQEYNNKTTEVEKSTIVIKRISSQAGEYWCEAHSSINFELIHTNYVLLQSKSSDEHIFSLRLNVKNACPEPSSCNPNWEDVTDTVKKLLKAKDVRVMSVLGVDINGTAEVLFHIDIKLIMTDSCANTCAITKTYRLLQELSETVFNSQSNLNFIKLKSTMYCMPVENDDTYSLHWEIASIGAVVAPKEFCMQENGLPVTRMCQGTFLMGGTWDGVAGFCSERYEATNKTTYLYSIARGNSDVETVSEFLSHGLLNILDDKENLIPADIYFMSMSLKVVVEISDANSTMVDLGDTSSIATTVDSFMDISEDYINLAQTMNSSNVILESLDIILSKIASNESGISISDENGVDRAVTSQFIIQISDPSISNVTGIALIRKPGYEIKSFANFNIIPLYANTSLLEVLNIKGLEIATWVTEEILSTIRSLNAPKNITGNTTEFVPPSLKIIIAIYYNDIIFQETKPMKDIVNSRVVSVTIPGYESDLIAPLPMVYRRFEGTSTHYRQCAYWDFKVFNHQSLGEWSHTGCFLVTNNSDLDVCACFHLTHFAQLVLGNKGNQTPEDSLISDYHGRALNAITIVGCTLSLLGTIGIFTTAMVFRSWRQKPGTKVLLQLSAAIALQYLNMLLQSSLADNNKSCVILGALLHYSVLASFMWMLLTALLQFARYVKVLGVQRPARFMLKFSVIGWGLPLLPVITLLFIDYTAYIPFSDTVEARRDTSGALCYPKGLGLYLTVLLPILCIVITNCTVFILVIRSIMVTPGGKTRQCDPELIASQLRLSVLLFFLLGLSWIFGLLAMTGSEILFSYLFCLTATMQGFVLFVYFVICDPATRILWVSLVRDRSKYLSRETTSNT